MSGSGGGSGGGRSSGDADLERRVSILERDLTTLETMIVQETRDRDGRGKDENGGGGQGGGGGGLGRKRNQIIGQSIPCSKLRSQFKGGFHPHLAQCL